MKKHYNDEKITGSIYTFEDNELTQYPLNLDGTPDWETPIVVDWDYVATELPLPVDGKEIDLYKHLKRIEKKLTK